MTRYFIESIRLEEECGGMACGPVCGAIDAEAKVRTDDGEEFYLILCECTGLPEWMKSNESLLDRILKSAESEDPETFDEYYLPMGEYEEFFENPDIEGYDLYRYMIYVVRAEEEEGKAFMKATTGKWIDEIDIPMSDIEEEYLDEMEYEE